jgi:toxin ParE1/3/4
MKFIVSLVEEAERDLLEIHQYVSSQDSPFKADDLLARLEATCASLESCPEKGHIPPELNRIGVKQFREIHFKPYRILYEISRREVFIYAILDGRRDMQTLLERRLLR